LKLPRRNFLHLAASAAALPAVSRFASAQAYSSRPVRLIAGFPPGGVLDLFARLIGQWLSERLGQPFIIENRRGAGGNLAREGASRRLSRLHPGRSRRARSGKTCPWSGFSTARPLMVMRLWRTHSRSGVVSSGGIRIPAARRSPTPEPLSPRGELASLGLTRGRLRVMMLCRARFPILSAPAAA